MGGGDGKNRVNNIKIAFAILYKSTKQYKVAAYLANGNHYPYPQHFIGMTPTGAEFIPIPHSETDAKLAAEAALLTDEEKALLCEKYIAAREFFEDHQRMRMSLPI